MRYSHPDDNSDAGLLLTALRQIYAKRGEDYDARERKILETKTEPPVCARGHYIRREGCHFCHRKLERFFSNDDTLTLITLRSDLRHIIDLLGPEWEPMSREEIRDMLVKALEKAQ